MRGPERLAAALTPRRWPLRWRLAAVSAALTLVILVAFALVVGRLVSDRMESDFDEELRTTADRLAFEIEVRGPSATPDPRDIALGGSEVVRVIGITGEVIAPLGARPVAPPAPGITTADSLRIATAPIETAPEYFVQYGRSTDGLDATVNRLWLFLGAGVLGGALLAMLAGLAVAGRAMRPIAALTAAAREIATTRDPSRRVPQPEAEDEVAELARTLDEMLRELDAARAEAEQMMQAQRDFVADASHELRTPLTSILANLELLQVRLAEAGAEADDAESLGSALRSSRRMGRLVGDLLLLARADAGRGGVRAECDLAGIADAALAEVRPVAAGHELALDADGEVPVEGNADELHRLVVNLLDNGIRHTPPGTRIAVSVARDDGDAVLEVADDGPGLVPGMEQQVFSRFVRAGGAAGGGVGLGLAIVRAVAASHGGGVEAGRSDAGGARFVVRLPVRKN